MMVLGMERGVVFRQETRFAARMQPFRNSARRA